jgi:pentatricopeptide repeat protein
MRGRCSALLSRQGSSLQWRGEGTARSVVAHQQVPPRPTTPPPNTSALRECLAALAQAGDTATQRRALADIRQRASAARKGKEGKINVYQYLGPLDLGLILRRAVAVGDWGIAERVLAHGGDKVSFPTAAMAEAALLACCREGKPEVAQSILLKLLTTNSAPPPSASSSSSRSSSPSIYTVILRALGKAGHWEACLELLRQPVLAPLLVEDEACFEAGITACGRQGCVEEAMGLYDDFRAQQQQRHSSFTSAAIHNAAIKACARGGSLARAQGIIREAQQDGVLPSVAAFNALLLTCGRLGAWDAGAKVLVDMKALGVDPNEVR